MFFCLVWEKTTVMKIVILFSILSILLGTCRSTKMITGDQSVDIHSFVNQKTFVVTLKKCPVIPCEYKGSRDMFFKLIPDSSLIKIQPKDETFMILSIVNKKPKKHDGYVVYAQMRNESWHRLAIIKDKELPIGYKRTFKENPYSNEVTLYFKSSPPRHFKCPIPRKWKIWKEIKAPTAGVFLLALTKKEFGFRVIENSLTMFDTKTKIKKANETRDQIVSLRNPEAEEILGHELYRSNLKTLEKSFNEKRISVKADISVAVNIQPNLMELNLLEVRDYDYSKRRVNQVLTEEITNFLVPEDLKIQPYSTKNILLKNGLPIDSLKRFMCKLNNFLRKINVKLHFLSTPEGITLVIENFEKNQSFVDNADSESIV